MTDDQARERLDELLEQYTLGSVLHLLAESCRESAEDAQQDSNESACDQFHVIEHTLFVMGLGIDAANPSS